jgi:hypothetical protein
MEFRFKISGAVIANHIVTLGITDASGQAEKKKQRQRSCQAWESNKRTTRTIGWQAMCFFQGRGLANIRHRSNHWFTPKQRLKLGSLSKFDRAVVYEKPGSIKAAVS